MKFGYIMKINEEYKTKADFQLLLLISIAFIYEKLHLHDLYLHHPESNLAYQG